MFTLADIYEQNAKECEAAAKRTDQPVERSILRRMGQQWARDASALRAADAAPFSDHGRAA
jgi:hypothetical protein